MTGIITDKKNAFTKYLSKSLRLSALTIATSLTVGQISCAPIVSNVGYVFDEETLNQVTVGSSSKEMVRSIMGVHHRPSLQLTARLITVSYTHLTLPTSIQV